jgi:mercuric ion transport protein
MATSDTGARATETQGEILVAPPATRGPQLVAVGSVLAAVAAFSCCLLPFALAVLGVSGAWLGALTRLAPYQPIFLAATLGLLAAGFVLAYRRPGGTCGTGQVCARPGSDRVVKLALWTAAVLAAGVLVFPYAVRPFLD